jgi:hypothetical protein
MYSINVINQKFLLLVFDLEKLIKYINDAQHVLFNKSTVYLSFFIEKAKESKESDSAGQGDPNPSQSTSEPGPDGLDSEEQPATGEEQPMSKRIGKETMEKFTLSETGKVKKTKQK